MFSLISVCLSALILLVYVVVFVSFHGLPESVSDSYYCIKHKWMFSLIVAVCGALLLIPWLTLNDDFQCFAFLSVASLMFIAASPAFKEGLTRSVHIGAAIILGVSAFAWLILTSGVPYIAITAILAGLLFDRRRFVFWLEVGLLYNLYTSLILILSSC